MKIEHLTIGGNSAIRDTADILPTTRRKLDSIRLSYESKFITIPVLPFKIRITATEQGAAFDIMRGEDIAITNLCCFEQQYSEEVLAGIYQLSDMFNKKGWNVSVITPITPCWIYSTIVNPLILTPEEMQLAGEVELYIFEQLYLAKND